MRTAAEDLWVTISRFFSFFRSAASPAILAILIVSTGISIASYFSVAAGFRYVLDARDGQRETGELMRGLLDQETAVRGFTSTRQRLFLQPYYAADPKDFKEFGALGTMLERLHLRYAGYGDFMITNDRWDAIAHDLIEHPAAPNATVEQIKGKRLMDRMRAYDDQLAAIFQEAALEGVAATERRLLLAGVFSAMSIVLLGIVGITLERRRRFSERALRESIEAHAKELERSNAALGEYAYVASHDLQEPLRMVSSYTQLLKRRYGDKLDDDAKEFIEFAYDGAKRMETLIKDLLAYSKLGADRSVFETFDAQTAYDDAIANLEFAIQESAAQIEAGALPAIHGNRSQIVLLLQNLIGNALKYRGSEAPRVRIFATREGAEWKFCVSDNGIGIDPQYGERIFKMFQRLHTRSEYSGTGIGLAVVKRIVESHEGRVWG